MLSKARWTFAVEASNRVNAQELAVVLLGGTFIQIFAGLAIFLQDVASWTRALVAALCIFAYKVARFRRLRTFIQINASCSSNICGIAQVAVTAERSNGIYALSIFAQVRKHFTFINISAISSKARAMWTHLLKWSSSRKGTEFTLVTPASPHITAAF